MNDSDDKVTIGSSNDTHEFIERDTTEESSAQSFLSADELSLMIEELCHSKAEEFSFFGYKNITGQEIWECVSSRYKKGMPPLYKIVDDILSLRVNTFMDWALMSVYKR
jgi:hypothetical protein